DLYQDTPNSILIVSEIIGMDQAEIEDLIPPSIMKKLSRYQLRSNDPDSDFEDYYAKDLPILKQLEEFAVTNEIMLEKGWKVEFAKLVKNHLLKISRDKISEDTINIWKTLFSKLN
ncbi:OLD family endonuclease, partial [Acinetobacter junii]|nr:OLD family endonuclease [Acinetobacter junii]